MTILAVDFGTKRLGVAVTNTGETLALPIDSFHVKTEKDAVDLIQRLAADRAVREIVMGNPIGHHGGSTRMGGRVQAFAELLRAVVKVPVILVDERFTSKLAEAPMIEAGMSAQKRRGLVDAGAAALILQSVLDARRMQSERGAASNAADASRDGAAPSVD